MESALAAAVRAADVMLAVVATSTAPPVAATAVTPAATDPLANATGGGTANPYTNCEARKCGLNGCDANTFTTAIKTLASSKTHKAEPSLEAVREGVKAFRKCMHDFMSCSEAQSSGMAGLPCAPQRPAPRRPTTRPRIHRLRRSSAAAVPGN